MKRKTRYVLLGLLREEDLTGYEIKKSIDIRMSFFWKESYGQIYPELNQLLEEGLITILNAETKESSKREKNRYRITQKGREEFNEWMGAENEKDTIRSEFLLKMFLSTKENDQEMHKHIAVFLAQMESQLALFRLFEGQLRADYDLHNNHQQILNVLELGTRQSELYIEWGRKMLQETQANTCRQEETE